MTITRKDIPDAARIEGLLTPRRIWDVTVKAQEVDECLTGLESRPWDDCIAFVLPSPDPEKRRVVIPFDVRPA